MIDARIAFVSLVTVLLLSGCYRGPGTENPENTRNAPFVPWGVVSGSDGLYPSEAHYRCCGLGKEASLQVVAPNRPRHLFLKFYTVNFSDFTHRPESAPQSIEVFFSPKSHPVFRGLRPNGLDSLTVAIPSDARIERNVLFLKLRMGRVIVPAQYNPGGDPRPYSIVLLAAETGH